MTTVACVWVAANVPYSVEYVANLRAMVAKHLPARHEFVCLTDRPWLLPDGVRGIPVKSPAPLPGWWSKLQLFDAALPLSGRVLYLDLDTLVVADLTPLVEHPARLVLAPHGGTFRGRYGRLVVPRFNSSVMCFHGGEERDLWESWSPAQAERLWGDQDWIGERRPYGATFPAAWVPRLSEVGGPPFAPEVKVVLSKKPKNHEAALRWPWFDRLWRAA